ncbi:MAG: ABC transporter ATP-binding protein [Pseudomonadota bacterium]
MPQNDSRSAINVENVHLSLGQGPARVDILRGATVSVAGGTSVGIVGPSGSGKSTLLMVLAGLERPTSGTVSIGDAVLTDMSEDELAAFRGREIGIVFQSFHLIPTMTALENVAVPLELAGHEDPFGTARAELEAVGLGQRLSHYPTQLSGGEQQRVAVARALAPKPAILVADEPTGNLDGKTGDQIADLLFSAPKERGTTLVLVTHDLDLSHRCERSISIAGGRIVEDQHELAPHVAEAAE